MNNSIINLEDMAQGYMEMAELNYQIANGKDDYSIWDDMRRDIGNN